MRLSRAAQVALAALPLLDPRGTAPGAIGRGVRELSHEARVPAAFLAKVFQRLVDRGLLRSKRGRAGGFLLGRPADEITLGDVVLAFESAEGLEAAFPPVAGPAARHLEPARRAFLEALEGTTLDALREVTYPFARSGGDPAK